MKTIHTVHASNTMSSGGAFCVAVAMNDVKQLRALRREKLEGAKETLLAEDPEAEDTIRTQVLSTIKLPDNGCTIL